MPGLMSPLTVTLRTRRVGANRADEVVERTEVWNPRHTALLICDMWDRHWCSDASRRVDELAPVMNRVVDLARRSGAFIIHAPSDTLDAYADTSQRRRALDAPLAKKPPFLHALHEPPLPIDHEDGGCTSGDERQYNAWTRQHPALRIAEEDAISDNGDEVYNLMRAHAVEHIIVMGVHTNMCVLARSFGLRQLAAWREDVAFMRDMTDSMYNPQRSPFVDHFEGTDLVVRHIERYICPTLTSSVFTGEPRFRFAEDTRAALAD